MDLGAHKWWEQCLYKSLSVCPLCHRPRYHASLYLSPQVTDIGEIEMLFLICSSVLGSFSVAMLLRFLFSLFDLDIREILG